MGGQQAGSILGPVISIIVINNLDTGLAGMLSKIH